MTLLNPRNKIAGLLVPVFALRHPEDLGIGDTRAVREAIDFCAAHRFAVLQILPIHETVGDHSPYNAISSRALSPALLAVTPDDVPGLSREILDTAAPPAWRDQLRAGNVKHNSVHPLKLQILLSAHRTFLGQTDAPAITLQSDFLRFKTEQAYWLCPYTLFRLLIREYEGNPNWTEWRPGHHTLAEAEAWLDRHPEREKLEQIRHGLAFIQWVGWRQWTEVRAHATKQNVMLMGEMSFGVGRCSADVWAHPELFDADWHVGTRPISYFDTNKDSERWGQNWGLPPYRWENHRSTGFSWLRNRVAGERQFFHICRLDHLRGYFRAYMFPWPGGARHAEFATFTEEEARQHTGGRLPRFVPGPDEDPGSARMNDLQGREIISVIQEAAQDMYLIAEIMGAMPDYMRRALDDLRVANLTFPQLERNPDRSLQPKDSFRVLSLATYANHDHAPLAATYAHLHEQAVKDPNGTEATDLRNLLAFAGWNGPPPANLGDDLHAALVRALFETPCELAVLMSSDLLATPQRFNLPGSYGADTWCERLEFPLRDYATHPVYKNRIDTVARLIVETGRAP
jgi:4-alpha-glucanotransferase